LVKNWDVFLASQKAGVKIEILTVWFRGTESFLQHVRSIKSTKMGMHFILQAI